jgi:uncharacterized delta-60 repeat protein
MDPQRTDHGRAVPWIVSTGLALGLMISLVKAGNGYDRTLVVNDPGDFIPEPPGAGGELELAITLRSALNQASVLGGRTLIRFDRDMVITNFEGQLMVSADVTIHGRGTHATVIDAHQRGRAFSIGTWANPIVHRVRLENMTVTNGLLTAEGSGPVMGAGLINYSSELTLSNVVLMHHRAVGDSGQAHHGAISSTGPRLTLDRCVLGNNQAAGQGGALGCTGEVVIRHSVFESNRAGWGGAIHNTNANVRVENSLFHANHASVDGGAIYTASDLSLTDLDNCTLSGNTTAGRGGALFHDLGGGTLRHVTLAFNRAAEGGGGLYHSSPAPYPAAWLQNCLLAFNFPNNGAGVTSRIMDQAGNVATDDTCNTPAERQGDPVIGPLADHGGSTLTHALYAGSLALDRADPAVSLSTDQRGQPRPRDGTGDLIALPDAGAFEAQTVPPSPRPEMVLISALTHFGEIVVDGPPATAAITILNTGPLPVTVYSIGLTQENDFMLDFGSEPGPVFPVTIAVGGSWALDLRFVPQTEGPFESTLVVTGNDAVNPRQALTFTGQARLGVPALEILPPTLDFGPVALGESAEMTLALVNVGDGYLEIGPLEWVESSAAVFALLEDQASGLALAPNQQANVTVGFVPNRTGQVQATLHVPSNDPDREGDPYEVSVSGDGIVLSLMAGEIEVLSELGYGQAAVRAVAFDAELDLLAAGSWQAASDPRDSTGFILNPGAAWTHRLEMGPLGSGRDDSTDQFLAVTTDSARHVIATGIQSGAFATDGYHQAIVVRKLAPEGELVWEQTYHEFAWNAGRAVAVDQHDNILVAGNVHTSFAVNHQWVILKYDPEGELQPGFPLRANFSNHSTPWDLAHGIAIHPSGRFVVVGQRAVSAGNLDWHVRCYQPDGALLWQDTYAGAAGGHDIAWDAAFTSTGDLVVAGTVNEGVDNELGADYHWWVIGYTPEGQRAWTHSYPAAAGPGENVTAIAIDALGQILVGGTMRDAQGLPQWRVAQLNRQDGTLQLEQTWHSPAGQVLHDLAVRNGRMAIGGSRGADLAQSAVLLAGSYRGEPVLLLDPDALDFGPVAIGQTARATLLVANRSDETIVFAPRLDDDGLSTAFQLLDDPLAGGRLEPGDTGEVRIAFRPGEIGAFQTGFDLRELGNRYRVWHIPVSGAGVPLLPLGAEVFAHAEPGGPGSNAGWGVTFNREGVSITAGTLTDSDESRLATSGFVRKHGTQGWIHRLQTRPVTSGMEGASIDQILAVTVDNANHVIVVGQQSGALAADGYHHAMVIRKLSPSGDLIWSRTYHNSPWNTARAVATDAANHIYVAGHTFNSVGFYHQWAILKFDPAGELQAGFPLFYDQARLEGPWDVPHGIAAWPDGEFVVVGQVVGGLDNLDWHVRHYRPDGQLAGVDTYDRARGLHDIARSVAIDRSGNFVVAGAFNRGPSNTDQPNYDWLVIRYDRTTRQRLWTFTFESAPGRSEQAYGVAVDALGRVLVAGSIQDETGALRACLLQLAAEDGALLARHDWPFTGQFHAVATHDRDIALTGFAGLEPAQDALTVVHRIPEPRITGLAFGTDSVTVRWQFLMRPATLWFSPSWVDPDWTPVAEGLTTDYWTGPRPAEPQGVFRLLER